MTLWINSKKIVCAAMLSVVQLILCVGLFLPASLNAPWLTTSLTTSPIVATYESSAQVPDPGSIDIDRASDKADEASDKVFDGLDTTKRIIGKTDKRNEIIQKARETASGKLKALSDRAEQAPDAESLTPPDKQVLDQIQN
jgi:hypothetical protein